MYVCKIQTLHSCVTSPRAAPLSAALAAYFQRNLRSVYIEAQFLQRLHGTAD